MTKVTEDMTEAAMAVLSDGLIANPIARTRFKFKVEEALEAAMTAAQESVQISPDALEWLNTQHTEQESMRDIWDEGSDEYAHHELNMMWIEHIRRAMTAAQDGLQVDRDEIGFAVIVYDGMGGKEWESYFEGDKQGETMKIFDIPADAHPIGTRIAILSTGGDYTELKE